MISFSISWWITAKTFYTSPSKMVATNRLDRLERLDGFSSIFSSACTKMVQSNSNLTVKLSLGLCKLLILKPSTQWTAIIGSNTCRITSGWTPSCSRIRSHDRWYASKRCHRDGDWRFCGRRIWNWTLGFQLRLVLREFWQRWKYAKKISTKQLA